MNSISNNKRHSRGELDEFNCRPIFFVKVHHEPPGIDKRGLRILIGCIITAIIILSLCLAAISYINPDCDLVFIDNQQLKNITLNHWSTEEPFLSRDSTLLIRLSAHLEYNTDEQDYPLSEFLNLEQQWKPNSDKPMDYSSQQNHTQPDQKYFENLTDSEINRERFVVLDFGLLSTREHKDNRTSLKLNSKCSVITMSMVRKPDRIYVDRISLDLRISGEPKKSCDLELPDLGAFNVKMNSNGLAHYFCDEPRLLRFSCFQKSRPRSSIFSSSSSNIERDVWIADLFIHLLEFEVKDDRDELEDYELTFESPVSKCVV